MAPVLITGVENGYRRTQPVRTTQSVCLYAWSLPAAEVLARAVGRGLFWWRFIHRSAVLASASAPDRRRRTVGANCKNLPKIALKKFVKLTRYTCSCNSLTNFEYQVPVKWWETEVAWIFWNMLAKNSCTYFRRVLAIHTGGPRVAAVVSRAGRVLA